MSDPKETLSSEQKSALEQLGSAVIKKDNNWSDHAFVGEFNVKNAFTLKPIEHVNPDASMRTYSNMLESEERIIDAKNGQEFYAFIENEHEGNFAYHSDGEIVLPKYIIKDAEFKEKLSNVPNVATQFVAGDTAAELAIFAHEGYAHALHGLQNSGKNDTPYMAAIQSDMTEQIACFEEHMTYAQLYTNAKSQGIETLQLNGKDVPTDQLLDVYPILKEEVKKNGFNVQDPDCRERIAQISSQYWNENRAEYYIKQAQKHATTAEEYPLMGAIVNAREWEQRKELMVHNLRVPGNAQEFDAPECLKYFEPSPERVEVITAGHPSLSNEQLIALDKYMDQRGLKTDEEKETFLVANMGKICKREADADKDFEAFLLANSSPDKQEIRYADSLLVAYNDNTVTISPKDKESVTVPTSLLMAMDNGNLSQSGVRDETVQVLKEQKGEYPPECAKTDAYTLEAAAQFNAYVACGDMKKKMEQNKVKEVSEPTTQHDSQANALSAWIQQQQQR